MPDHLLCNLRSPDCTCAANTAEDLILFYPCHFQPVVNRLLHPFRHWHRTDVPSFPDEVNNDPMVFPALNMVKGQINEFFSTETASKEYRKDSSIPFSLHGLHIGKLPEGSGFIHGQPISESHAQFLCALHATNAGGQIRTEESRICRFIGEPSDCCKPHVDGARCKQLVFQMNPIAGDHCFVKGKPRFGTIPANEIVDGTPIAALRFRRPETYQHCRLDVLQIRKTQFGLLPIRFSCSWFSSHGYHLPTGKRGMAGFAITYNSCNWAG